MSLVGVVAGDPLIERTFIRLPRHNGLIAAEVDRAPARESSRNSVLRLARSGPWQV